MEVPRLWCLVVELGRERIYVYFCYGVIVLGLMDGDGV
jgi:hypothetical protein